MLCAQSLLSLAPVRQRIAGIQWALTERYNVYIYLMLVISLEFMPTGI